MANEWLARKEAAAFLQSLGCRVTPRRLAQLASNGNAGNGPPYIRSGWRTVGYNPADLREWAARRSVRIGQPLLPPMERAAA